MFSPSLTFLEMKLFFITFIKKLIKKKISKNEEENFENIICINHKLLILKNSVTL